MKMVPVEVISSNLQGLLNQYFLYQGRKAGHRPRPKRLSHELLLSPSLEVIHVYPEFGC